MQSKIKKINLLTIFSFSFLLLCSLCDSVVCSPPASEPRWLSDWEEGRKAARASGKPLFVVFRCQH
jgi:hypothetical protein